ncbi:MAG: hypothetical protein WKG01_06235 [Kofleriaceae bacterium]
MRNLAVLIMFALVSPSRLAAADTPPTTGEVIHVRDPVPAKPITDLRKPLPYSDDAILGDAWAKAWLLLLVDAKGKVTQLSVLVRPGYALEPIAVREAWKLAFEPARDAGGMPIPSYFVWGVEWPSAGWMEIVHKATVSVRLPAEAQWVPCQGTGPMPLPPLHYPTMRDCRQPPDTVNVTTIKWQMRPR